jgi:hypothetical protein
MNFQDNIILISALIDFTENNLQNPAIWMYLVWPTYELYCSQQLAVYDMRRQF